jgi:hypothetical protein
MLKQIAKTRFLTALGMTKPLPYLEAGLLNILDVARIGLSYPRISA